MPDSQSPVAAPLPLDPAKFRDPLTTADGSRRAAVGLKALETLWFNTGTLCNIACANCYIESSPTNDRLEYLSLLDVKAKLDEIRALGLPTREIGFTGGEPFMNPDFVAMLALALDRGFEVLVLTNAMRPMQRHRAAVRGLIAAYGAKLTFRISLDHYAQALHEVERGPNSWAPAIRGMKELAADGARLSVAGRLRFADSEADARGGFARLFREHGLDIDAADPARLVLFPEMDADRDTPEITEACWGILDKSPDTVMCATARMVVKHKGAGDATVAACTLIPYDPAFDLGGTLAGAAGPVPLNHPHCARFCVLGGASCSG
ncbi:MAG: radical SAM protein [Alphaproteobacteria bacterium]